MTEKMSNGGLRLACEGDWCDRKFSPRRHFTKPRDIRAHAISYGWLTEPAPEQQPSIPGVDSGGPVRDLCPECRRRKS